MFWDLALNQTWAVAWKTVGGVMITIGETKKKQEDGKAELKKFPSCFESKH